MINSDMMNARILSFPALLVSVAARLNIGSEMNEANNAIIAQNHAKAVRLSAGLML